MARMTKDGIQPRVSVAMATFNGERYLRQQLESLAAQTRLPDELIVSDDASLDSTWGILEEFAERSPFPVRLTRNEHTFGFAQNFSRSLSLCTGDIVFLCDQDDVWLEEKISTRLQAFSENQDVYCLVTDAYICDQNLRHGGRTVLGAGIGLNGSCSAVRGDSSTLRCRSPRRPEAMTAGSTIWPRGSESGGRCHRPAALPQARGGCGGRPVATIHGAPPLSAALRLPALASRVSGTDAGAARGVDQGTAGHPAGRGRAPRRPARRAPLYPRAMACLAAIPPETELVQARMALLERRRPGAPWPPAAGCCPGDTAAGTACGTRPSTSPPCDDHIRDMRG